MYLHELQAPYAITQLFKRAVAKKIDSWLETVFLRKKQRERASINSRFSSGAHEFWLIWRGARRFARDRSRGNVITKVMNSDNFSQILCRPNGWIPIESRKSRHTYDQKLRMLVWIMCATPNGTLLRAHIEYMHESKS